MVTVDKEYCIQKLAKFYEVGSSLGSGSFSFVCHVTEKKSGRHYALKVLKKDKMESHKKMVESEIEILKQVKHKNIVYLHEILETKYAIFLVMEYVNGGELFDWIVDEQFYSERKASLLMKQLFSAILYLHKRNIAHRDLKPENILMSGTKESPILKLADFGLSKITGAETLLRTQCGTPGYVAPEVLLGKGYSLPVDMWSCGVIMYILCVGYPPFAEETSAELFKQILKGDYHFHEEYWDRVSEAAKDLIRKLLCVDPAKRITAQEACAHPWVAEGSGAFDKSNPGFITKMREFNARRKLKTGQIAAAFITAISKSGANTPPTPKET
eukprot:GCRY01000131.1.p1 GENE.GCRY01000131.1~~GCRY01000131.1.p1  ORF type:complete len:328 (+),score=74.58 GCRY01000131.1:199-1182(+)